MGLSDYEATTLSVSLTTSLVNEVVAKEGDLSDDDEVYKVRCCEERYFRAKRRLPPTPFHF